MGTVGRDLIDHESPHSGPERFWDTFYNWTSVGGIAVALLATTLTVALVTLDVISNLELTYLGVAYALLALIGGAALIVAFIGAAFAARRRRAGKPPRPWGLRRLDLARSRDRGMAIGAVAAVVLAFGILGAGTYKTVHYVESNSFCGGACHSVMEPQSEAHRHSPHARVDCVNCHVGSGAASFAQAKLHGIKQLWAVTTTSYDRPLRVPAHGSGTPSTACETCHWRNRWVGYKEKVYNYYGADKENTPSQLRLLINVGGGTPELGKGEGIHYHMLLGRTVRFVTRSEDKAEVLRIEVREPNGTTKVFRARGDSTPPEELAELPVHTMNCIDCHSRPAHQFISPAKSVNRALSAGQLDPALPYVKQQAIGVLSAQYTDKTAALRAIEDKLTSHFRDYPPPATSRDSVSVAIKTLQAIYNANFFPEMGVRWDTYPNNIGHRDTEGCFRCHNDGLVTSEGETVFTTCRKCHVVLVQSTTPSNGVDFAKGQRFFHSGDEEEIDEYTECTMCHDGGDGPY